MRLKYGLEDKPPLRETIWLGLQWFVLLIPSFIILGRVVAGLSYDQPTIQTEYLQKLIFVSAVAMLVQIIWGHRLPLTVGPSTVLLVGITATLESNPDAVHSSIFLGGVLLALGSVTGLFVKIKRWFTPIVVAEVMLLIAVTLTPTIIKLLFSPYGQVKPWANLAFAFTLLAAAIVAERILSGVWKSSVLLLASVLGSLAYFWLFPSYQSAVNHNAPFASLSFLRWDLNLVIDPGVLLAFIFCFLALLVNDAGSIQSVVELVKPDQSESRLNRGIFITGLTNILSGWAGIIGAVNYSASPGIIAATGCASRYPLLPAGAILLFISFFPALIGFISLIPPVVIGAVLIYVMASQVAAALMVAWEQELRFEQALVIAVPLMISMVITFMPAAIINDLPLILRPIVGNGFVVGVLTVLVMENVVFPERKKI